MIALLDVNVLVALSWPGHEAFTRARRWFARHANAGWATCPMTQAGFVRIISNPAFSRSAVSPAQAMRDLAATVKHPNHHFWRDEISLETATRHFAARIVGHQQLTDAYLLGLAIQQKGKLVTLDRSVATLLEDSTLKEHLEILEA